ncbi:hypothetical protein [Cellulosimicrobium composti]|uniref:hypothetical protein n=1 Tax=Cellulosimicrobium composti TaxID=2672572 RepID=UPI00379DF4A8
MSAEPTQELGRDGVAAVKRWLEATTHIELPFDVYTNPRYCNVEHSRGNKLLDLNGHFLAGNKDPIYVEGKRYSTDSNLFPQFQEFLAVAYSFAVKDRQAPYPKNPHWLWVTYHPFAVTKWPDLATAGQVVAAVNKCKDLVPEASVDQDIAREVAEKVWILVYNPKMHDITLTPKELKKVRTVIDRKGRGL